MMKTSDAVYLTKSRLVEIENELKDLKTAGRKAIAEKIAEARAHGDLSENAEYDAAKEAQSHHEFKIGKLEVMLSKVKIISPEDMPDNEVYILSVVKVLDMKMKEEITFSLVSPEEADFEQDKISVTSPIGKALLGKKKNEVVEVQVPDGIIKYKILNISKLT
jgi:transcription elongation factor GreA